PKPPPRGLETALVEDEPEAHDADPARQLCVVEVDPAGAVGAEEHAEPEERDEHWEAGACGRERNRDARREDETDEKNCDPFVHLAPGLAAADEDALHLDVSVQHDDVGPRTDREGADVAAPRRACRRPRR